MKKSLIKSSRSVLGNTSFYRTEGKKTTPPKKKKQQKTSERVLMQQNLFKTETISMPVLGHLQLP